jgi:hypothetical protein
MKNVIKICGANAKYRIPAVTVASQHTSFRPHSVTFFLLSGGVVAVAVDGLPAATTGAVVAAALVPSALAVAVAVGGGN